jgi:mono/diheme cytochrome c family protein
MRLGFIAVAALGVGLIVACTPPVQTPTGAEDFADLCAPCHGPTGVGNGPMAADLVKRPADLTGLSARNGGKFPLLHVMNKIWGYTKGHATPSMMPKFAPLLEGPTVMLDMGDGVETPTPQRLINLADYLRTIQK